MRVLLLCFTFACLACDSFASSPNSPATRAPKLDCGDCFVVNAALATRGESVFVGGYVGDTNRGVLRRFADSAWKNLELGAVSAILQLSAAEDGVYLSAEGRAHRLDLATDTLEALDARGARVWASASDDVLVFDV